MNEAETSEKLELTEYLAHQQCARDNQALKAKQSRCPPTAVLEAKSADVSSLRLQIMDMS